ncbi:hypothetical protein GGI1_16310, partial [Acidithiobacillus sp. GGI-221]
AALTKPILYLQKLVQEAKTGRFDPSGFSGFVAPANKNRSRRRGRVIQPDSPNSFAA